MHDHDDCLHMLEVFSFIQMTYEERVFDCYECIVGTSGFRCEFKTVCLFRMANKNCNITT